MTVFCLARIAALLYGFAWPLSAIAMRWLAVASFMTLPFEIVVVVSIICEQVKRLQKTKEGK